MKTTKELVNETGLPKEVVKQTPILGFMNTIKVESETISDDKSIYIDGKGHQAIIPNNSDGKIDGINSDYKQIKMIVLKSEISDN